MTIELYHAGLTTCSKKARLCLNEKGVDYTSRYVNLRDFENHTPEYLALNPNGVVPTLVHDGQPVVESTFINEYIDEVFPGPSLTPSDPLLRAKMRSWGKMADDYGLAAVRIPTWSRTKQAGIDALKEADKFDATVARIPLQDHRDKYRQIAAGGFSQKEFDDAYAKMDFVYDRVEKALAEGGPYLVGDMFTLADINMLPFIDQFAKYRPQLFEDGAHPKTKAWLDLVMSRPAVIKVYNPSDEAPVRPPASQSAA